MITYQTFEEYAAMKRLNASAVVAGQKSPRHMLASLSGVDNQETIAKKLGQTMHAAVLEPDTFEKRFAVLPDYHLSEANVTGSGERSTSKRTNFCKERTAAFAERVAANNQTVITAAEYETALAMLEGIQTNADARAILETGDAKLEHTVMSSVMDTECKARVDLFAGDLVADVKSTRDASPWKFSRQALGLQYPLRFAFYRSVLRAVDIDITRFKIIAVENVYPHDCVVFDLPVELIDAQVGKMHQAIAEYAQAKDTGVWPGIAETMQLPVPDYAFGDEEPTDWGGVSDESSAV